MVKTIAHITVSSVWIAFTAVCIKFNLLGKILNSLGKLLHFTIDQSNVGVGNWIVRIEGK